MTDDEVAVFEEITRRATGAVAATPNSAMKLGLVVEGGAMRGAVSMAYLAALERHRMGSVFDVVFAESAGAINAAYFVSGQTKAGLEFYRLMQSRRPMASRWWIGALDLDAVFEAVIAGPTSIDLERLRNNSTVVYVSLTSAADGSPAIMPLAGPDDRIYTILKATAAIVPYHNRPVLLAGRGFVDGGIADPLPAKRAIEAGCTHILFLLTRPRNYSPRKLRLWEHLATRILVARWSGEFQNVFHRGRPRRYDRSRGIALGHEAPPSGVHIASIAPPQTLGRIQRFFTDAHRLQEVIDKCSVQMDSAINQWTRLAR